MSTEELKPGDADPALDADPETIAIDDGKGNKVVSLRALQDERARRQASDKRVKEMEPLVAQGAEIRDKLGRVQPIIDAVLTNPRLRADALRAIDGTRASAESTDQPDDPDASAVAEEFGLYLSDGMTPDAARGKRILARLDQRHGRQTAEAIRPFAGYAAGTQADANLRHVLAQTDADGAPLVTEESVREIAKQLPANLLANPQVIELVLNSAIGLDRRNGRTPKAPDEPLFMESAGGRGRRPETITADERKSIERLGITEKEYTDSVKRLEEGVANRRGIVLGR